MLDKSFSICLLINLLVSDKTMNYGNNSPLAIHTITHSRLEIEVFGAPFKQSPQLDHVCKRFLLPKIVCFRRFPIPMVLLSLLASLVLLFIAWILHGSLLNELLFIRPIWRCCGWINVSLETLLSDTNDAALCTGGLLIPLLPPIRLINWPMRAPALFCAGGIWLHNEVSSISLTLTPEKRFSVCILS